VEDPIEDGAAGDATVLASVNDFERADACCLVDERPLRISTR